MIKNAIFDNELHSVYRNVLYDSLINFLVMLATTFSSSSACCWSCLPFGSCLFGSLSLHLDCSHLHPSLFCVIYKVVVAYFRLLNVECDVL